MHTPTPHGGNGFASLSGMLRPVHAQRLPVLSIVIALAVVPMLGGCKHTDHFAGPQDSMSYAPVEDRHPSLATDAPPLASATNASTGVAQPLAWYDVRNDARLSTFSGNTSPTFESAVTVGYDRQYTSGGRVFDYYNQTTYKSSITTSSK